MEGKWIDGFENKYKIYINGDVESYFKNDLKKMMNPSKNADGYLRVGLRKKGERKHFTIHRLIAIYFIPNPDNKPNIDHIDGDRTNNSIVNLRWVTQHENTLNRRNEGKYKKGVHFNKAIKKFRASITINGKQTHLGYFETEDEGHEAFKQKFFEQWGYESCSR
mgnify:CR=1 FL=1